MSLIHLEKSVFTFHFKEMLEDGHGNDPLTWLGLAVLLFGPKLVPALAKTSRPVAKTLLKQGFTQTAIPLSQWIAEAQKRELQTQQYVVISTPIQTSENKPQASASNL